MRPLSPDLRYEAPSALDRLRLSVNDVAHLAHHLRHRKNRRSLFAKGPSEYCLSDLKRREVIFIHIPKAAGVSINRALYGSLGGGHRTVGEYKRLFGPLTYRRYFSFAFVRDPAERLRSAFEFLKGGGFNEADRLWAAKNIGEFDDFDKFVERWLSEESVWSYHHFKPQWHYICDTYPFVELDFLGRFERIEEDLYLLSSLIQQDLLVGHQNRTRRPSNRPALAPRIASRIRSVYARDYELLGYD